MIDLLIGMAIGAVLGFATLRWRIPLGGRGTHLVMWVTIVTCIWPVLLLAWGYACWLHFVRKVPW